MIQIHRPLCPELTFRLAHDISPDYYPDAASDDEYSTSIQREKFLFSCLAQAKTQANAINNNNSIKQLSPKSRRLSFDRTDRITETLANLEWKQNQLEQINNQINEQHLTKVLADDTTDINVINNNFLEPNSTGPCESERRKAPSSNAQTHENTSRRPRRLPDILNELTFCATKASAPINVQNEKCLADELQEALTRPENSDYDSDDVFVPDNKTNPNKDIVYPKYSCHYLQELRRAKFNTVAKNTRAYLNSDNVYLREDSTSSDSTSSHVDGKICNDVREPGTAKERVKCTTKSDQAAVSSVRESKHGKDTKDYGKKPQPSVCSTNYHELTVTHRGMHPFVPRHPDEMSIEIGDPIHVKKTGDDFWCEGVNLRTNQQGIFPSMYATDLMFLEEEEEEEDGCRKFYMRFLGSVEVNYHKGNEVLCQAINKVALSRRAVKSSKPPPVCTVEVSQYGIRMFDKSKTGHEETDDELTHFFALKNISFCGHHPRNERYFGFITKHPDQYRYACHVFLGERSTCNVSEAMGQAFKRFYQEYMAFTHPTEDIYIE